jgi:hypothetical protein
MFACVSLTVRELGLIGPQREPRHPYMHASSPQHGRAWPPFFLRSGARWHLFCCCVMREKAERKSYTCPVWEPPTRSCSVSTAGHVGTRGGTNAARSTAMGRTTDTIKGHVKKAAEKVKDAAEKVKGKTVRAVDKGKDTAAQAAEKVQKQTDRTAEKVQKA